MATRTAGDVAAEHLRDSGVERVLELPGLGITGVRTSHARADDHPPLIQAHPGAVGPAMPGRVPVLTTADLLPGRRG